MGQHVAAAALGTAGACLHVLFSPHMPADCQGSHRRRLVVLCGSVSQNGSAYQGPSDQRLHRHNQVLHNLQARAPCPLPCGVLRSLFCTAGVVLCSAVPGWRRP